MSLLIDGYNLLHAAGIIPRGTGPGGLERARTALLNFLAASISEKERQRTIVVFDARAAPPGLPRETVHRGLSVRYAADHKDADSLIEELILAETSPRQLTVVSSDHRLHRAARRRKATPIDSDVWCAALVRSRQRTPPARPAAADHRTRPLSESELDYWLRQFSADPTQPLPPDIEQDPDKPFPPGYGEDLE